MKLSEIFSKNKIASTALEQSLGIDSSEVQGYDKCNCRNVFADTPIQNPKVDLTSEEGPKIRERSAPFHRSMTNNILDLIDNPTEENTRKIDSLIPGDIKDPEDRNKHLIDHLLTHATNGGMEPEELGLTSSDYDTFKQSKEVLKKNINDHVGIAAISAEGPQQPKDPHDCAECNGFHKQFNDGVKKYKQTVADRVNAAGPVAGEEGPPSPAYVNRTAEGLTKDVFENYQLGGDRPEDPELAGLHDTLSAWDEHHKKEHGITFNGIENKAPIHIDREKDGERNPQVEGLFDKLLNLPTGWDLQRRPDIPKKDPFFDEETGAPRITPAVGESPDSESFKERSQNYADQLLSEGVIKPYRLGPTTEKGKERTFVESPGISIEGIERHEESHPTTFAITPTPEIEPVYNPKGTPLEHLYEKPMHTGKDPEIVEPNLRTGLASSLPNHHRYLFQITRTQPDLRAFEEHASATHAYENQPTHTLQETGETETVPGEPQYEEKAVRSEKYDREWKQNWDELNSSGSDPSRIVEKHKEWEKKWHEENCDHSHNEDCHRDKKGKIDCNIDHHVCAAVKIEKVPKLDENGQQAVGPPTTRKKYKSVPVPDGERLPDPTFDAESANSAYRASFDTALSKAFPYIDTTTDEGKATAVRSLRTQHANKVRSVREEKRQSLKAKNRLIQASKDSKMFNSKEAAPTDVSNLHLLGMGAAVGIPLVIQDLRDKLKGQSQGKHLAPNMLKARQDEWVKKPVLDRQLLTDVHGPAADPFHEDHDISNDYDKAFGQKQSSVQSTINALASKLK